MMSWRSFTLCAAFAFAAFLCALPARAADEELQNMHGNVRYGHGATTLVLSPKSTTAINDSDHAITGADSLAAIGLPDSSRVLVGADSDVVLSAFNLTDIARAKFVVVGKVRFIVQHPQGAKADFTFATATGSVAVRGTEGDIDAEGTNLTVNVYEVCDPNAPVVVTAANGRTFTLVAGQSLAARLVNGVVQYEVQQLTQQMIDRFSPDFGVPTSWDAAKGEVISAATNQASGALDNATGGYGSQIAGAVGGMFGHKKATPTPSPSPASTSCSH
jgi:ferric-dicitrate binding protein FerR (iron transport regulator)